MLRLAKKLIFEAIINKKSFKSKYVMAMIY